jgi:hypothetical protein
MGDIMYLQQAIGQPDAKEFVQAVVKEINGHLYGPCGASAISQLTKSSLTRPG